MAKVLDNITEIIWVKNELRNILIAIGMNPTDDFSTYAGLFRQALQQIAMQTYNINGE